MIETERLILRPFQKGDAEDLYEYLDEKAKVFKVKNGEIVNS